MPLPDLRRKTLDIPKSEISSCMTKQVSEHTTDAIEKLVNIQRQIIGNVEIIRHKLVFPDDIRGIGLHWSHYVSKIQTATGFTVITAINADADYSFCVAFGDKGSDLSPYRYIGGRTEPLWNLTEETKPLKNLVGNLALRFTQVGLKNSGIRPERLDPVAVACPFNLLWTQVLLQHDFGNGITAIAGIDPTAHHVFMYFQADDGVLLDPRLVELAALRKAPAKRLKSFIYRADAMWEEDWQEKQPERFPDWIDETEFLDSQEFEENSETVMEGRKLWESAA